MNGRAAKRLRRLARDIVASAMAEAGAEGEPNDEMVREVTERLKRAYLPRAKASAYEGWRVVRSDNDRSR